MKYINKAISLACRIRQECVKMGPEMSFVVKFDNTKFYSVITPNAMSWHQIVSHQLFYLVVSNLFAPNLVLCANFYNAKFCLTKFSSTPIFTQLHQILFHCTEFRNSKFSTQFNRRTAKSVSAHKKQLQILDASDYNSDSYSVSSEKQR